MSRPAKDLEGNRYGRLVVTGLDRIDQRRGRMWRCVCDCGGERIERGDKLRAGVARSCGSSVCRAVMMSEGWRQRARRLAEDF